MKLPALIPKWLSAGICLPFKVALDTLKPTQVT